jgi:hypothetical protein
MNYAESFEEFSRGLTPTDLMVYGGAAIVLFVLFKDQLVPLKEKLLNWYNSLIKKTQKDPNATVSAPATNNKTKETDNDKLFLQLISSWKNTRDLAETMSCDEAVKILDSAFSHLGPNNCVAKNGEDK